MNSAISSLIDLPDSPAWQALVQRCHAELDGAGMFELPGFLKPQALVEKPGVRFTEAENLGFYKRARALPA